MRWRSYFLATTTILLLRTVDLFLTWVYTPDLEHEWNPIISFLGISWPGFILSQVLVFSFIAGSMLFYFRREPTVSAPNGLSFQDFTYFYFFGELRPWRRRFLSFPHRLRPHLVFNGFLMMTMSMIVSTFAIVNNLLLIAGVQRYVLFLGSHYRIFFPAFFITAGLGSSDGPRRPTPPLPWKTTGTDLSGEALAST
ncbi:MAG: hypothetical protein CVU65_02565 [Deltaproteobacteria bacterium HGW-Deltaproteobacteria-22]|nr:MAG: hypothetical protein CVU65_02565 [Deltaproteobacteria bacterium HGW-Deltaproteobacteria-22]